MYIYIPREACPRYTVDRLRCGTCLVCGVGCTCWRDTSKYKPVPPKQVAFFYSSIEGQWGATGPIAKNASTGPVIPPACRGCVMEYNRAGVEYLTRRCACYQSRWLIFAAFKSSSTGGHSHQDSRGTHKP